MRELSSSALAIAVLGLLEAIAMAKAIAAKTGQKLDLNQQCLSEGFANFAKIIPVKRAVDSNPIGASIATTDRAYPVKG